jgi:hypothetical protein
VPNFYKQLVFGAIVDFYGFRKGTLWTTFSPKPSNKKESTPDDLGCTSREPDLHENIVITVPFRPSA